LNSYFVFAHTFILGDVCVNVLAKHGKEFLRLSENHPAFLMGFASDFGLNLLASAENIYVDGTFNTTEGKLVLTVLLVVVESVTIPCAFLFFNTREKWAYQKFFEVCVVLQSYCAKIDRNRRESRPSVET
jgi:hypothetical protein